MVPFLLVIPLLPPETLYLKQQAPGVPQLLAERFPLVLGALAAPSHWVRQELAVFALVALFLAWLYPLFLLGRPLGFVPPVLPLAPAFRPFFPMATPHNPRIWALSPAKLRHMPSGFRLSLQTLQRSTQCSAVFSFYQTSFFPFLMPNLYMTRESWP